MEKPPQFGLNLYMQTCNYIPKEDQLFFQPILNLGMLNTEIKKNAYLYLTFVMSLGLWCYFELITPVLDLFHHLS